MPWSTCTCRRRRSRGLLFLVHGGFWKAEWDRTHTRPMARALADDGWVVATPEYRRVGGGGGWPTTGDDVRRGASTALPASCSRRSASRPRGPWSPVIPPAATSRCGSPRPARRWTGSSRWPRSATCGEAIRLGLGGHATEALLGDVDPAVADPMTLLDDRPAASVAIVHGVDDANVPVSLSRGFVERHPWVDLHEVPGRSLRGDRARLRRLADRRRGAQRLTA